MFLYRVSSFNRVHPDRRGFRVAVFLPSDTKYSLPLVHSLWCGTSGVRTHFFHFAMFTFDLHILATVFLEVTHSQWK